MFGSSARCVRRAGCGLLNPCSPPSSASSAPRLPRRRRRRGPLLVLLEYNPALADHPIEYHRGVSVGVGTSTDSGLTHSTFVKACTVLTGEEGSSVIVGSHKVAVPSVEIVEVRLVVAAGPLLVRVAGGRRGSARRAREHFPAASNLKFTGLTQNLGQL
jgi:hypothetical protein